MATRLPTTLAVHPVPSLPSNSPFNSSEYRKVVDKLSAIAAHPKPAEWQLHNQWEMPIIHLLLLQLMERIYAFADWAEEHDDLANYLGFAEIAIFGIWKHHQSEETILFPQWSEASGLDVWTSNAEQHKTFGDGLDATWLYLRRCRSNLTPTPPPSPVVEPPPEIASIDLFARHGLNPTSFSSDALRDHIATYLLPLAHHLTDEISALAPEYFEKVGEKNMKRIFSGYQAHLQVFHPSWFLCLFLSSLDAGMAKLLLPLPWFVTWILVPFWWRPTYWGFWRYCAHPQNLTFWGKA